MSAINNRFRLIRQALDLSQEKFGNEIGLSKSGISSIESGIRQVNAKHIKLVCSSFGISETWLREGRGEMFVRDKSDIDRLALKYNLSSTGRAVLEIYLQFDEAHRKVFDEALEAIASGILAAADHHKKEALFGPLSQVRRSCVDDQHSLLAAAGGDTEGLQAVVDDFEGADIDI